MIPKIIVVTAIVLSTGCVSRAQKNINPINLSPAVPCDDTLWVHVYHPKRLKVRQACISVTGVTVDATRGREKDGCRHEADGDGHCWLKLDAGQEGLLIPGNNASKQGGNLVFEPICRYTTTQADAVLACENWPGQKDPLPPVGSHVRITGAYIFDSQHGHVEIHPVTKIEVLP